MRSEPLCERSDMLLSGCPFRRRLGDASQPLFPIQSCQSHYQMIHRALAHRRHDRRSITRRHASLTAVVTATSSSALIPCVAAECWLRDDGTELCAPEPLAWRLAWWFWLVSLVAILMFLWCGDRLCCCCCYAKDKKSGSDDDDDEEDGTMVVVVVDRETIEPLLPQPLGKEQQQRNTMTKPTRCCKSRAPPEWHLVKPVYRYLDDS